MLKNKFVLLRAVLLVTPLIFLASVSFEILFLRELFFNQIVWILSFLGFNFKVQGFRIVTGDFSSTITFACTGWKQLYIFVALIFLPLNIEFSQRLKGLLFLVPLYLYNVFRIIISLYIGFISHSLFLPVHYFLWNFLFLCLVFIFWFYWYQKHSK